MRIKLFFIIAISLSLEISAQQNTSAPPVYKDLVGKEVFELLENQFLIDGLKKIILKQNDYDELTTNMVSGNPVKFEENFLVISGNANNEGIMFESIIIIDTITNKFFAATTNKKGKAYKRYSEGKEKAYPELFKKWIKERK